MTDDGSLDQSRSRKDGTKWLTSGHILKIECFRGPKTTFNCWFTTRSHKIQQKFNVNGKFITVEATEQKQQEKL